MSSFFFLLPVQDGAEGVSFGACLCVGTLIVTFLTGCFFASTLVSSVFFLNTLLNAKGVSSSDPDFDGIDLINICSSFLFLPFSKTASINVLMSYETYSTNLLALPCFFSLFFRLDSVSTSCFFYLAVPKVFTVSSIGASISNYA